MNEIRAKVHAAGHSAALTIRLQFPRDFDFDPIESPFGGSADPVASILFMTPKITHQAGRFSMNRAVF